MAATFNLTHEPWLPCLGADGRPREVGLYEALARAHELRALEGANPLETAALHRLLLALLQKVFPVPDAAAWWSLWQAGRWPEGPLETYLKEWQARFDLFHPQQPFYQARDDRVEPRSVAFLVPGLSAASVYNHEVETGTMALPAPAAARLLLVAQAFGLPGIRHPQLGLFFNGAPWSAGVVFLVEGNNLFQTLALNLLRYDPRHPLQELCRSKDDRPAWELDDPFSPARAVPLGYLDYLTWQNRRLRLLPEGVAGDILVRLATATPGLKLDAELRDPMKHYRADPKRGWLTLLLGEGRALWRDSSVLLSLRHSQVRPPVALEWLANLAEDYDLDRSTRYRLLGIGLLADQAKALLFRAERLPLPLDYLKDERLVAHLGHAVEVASAAQKALRDALRHLATVLLSRAADLPGGRQPDRKDVGNLVLHWGVERLYWAALELPFLRLVEDLPVGSPEEVLGAWGQVVRRGAWAALERAADTAGTGAGGLKAAAQARRRLTSQLSGIAPLAPAAQ